jgi:hypothetical protein
LKRFDPEQQIAVLVLAVLILGVILFRAFNGI